MAQFEVSATPDTLNDWLVLADRIARATGKLASHHLIAPGRYLISVPGVGGNEDVLGEAELRAWAIVLEDTAPPPLPSSSDLTG